MNPSALMGAEAVGIGRAVLARAEYARERVAFAARSARTRASPIRWRVLDGAEAANLMA
jgi:hypothetical protein